jgi:5-methylcytosine-specific restriction endonuclease McrBC GTP-binding regulatory subunit McrB
MLSVKNQEALKNKSKELFKIEIRMMEEFFNETNEQYLQKINIVMRKIISTTISIIKGPHRSLRG